MPDGRFDSGVSSYIEAEAVVKVFFPVDFRGNADVSCNQCFYYRRNYRNCALNDEVCEYPEHYVGSHCPLRRREEVDAELKDII